MKDYVSKECRSENERPDNSSPQTTEQSDAVESTDKQAEGNSAVEAVKSLLDIKAADLPHGVGKQLEVILSTVASNDDNALRVAQVSPRDFSNLSPAAVKEAKSATSVLKHRLQSLLQASVLKKNRPSRRGRLDTASLHGLFVGNPKIFRRSGVRIGLNTAVHLLIDVSSSMRSSIGLSSVTAYTLCEALSQTPGIKVEATAFPGLPLGPKRNDAWATVAPILKYGQAFHQKFDLTAEGSTPMGEALWWALQEMVPRPESRKIILILTDGDPDSLGNTKTAIAEALRLGFEIYGLGLNSSSIKHLLPGRSIVINQLADLPQAMFKLLGTALKRKETS